MKRKKLKFLPPVEVVAVTHRLSQETEQCIAAAQNDVHATERVHLTVRGASNVCTARNLAYTEMFERGTEQKWKPETVIVTLDDDIVFKPAALWALVKHVRETGRPASGIYGTQDGRMHACRNRGVQWECGLGFAAWTWQTMRELAIRLPSLRIGEKTIKPFCQDGIHPTLPTGWTPEDYWLSRELGGFELLPIPVGHLKRFPLWPDQQTIDTIANGDPLPKSDGTIPELKPIDHRGPSAPE